MTTKLQFDFLVDRKKNTLTMRREFAANRQMVWDAYTRSEYLDQWFAPETFTTKTKSMDFSPGGHWHYAMVDGDGNEYWGRTNYETIKPIENYTCSDVFCDENGEPNTSLPSARWNVDFIERSNHTIVETVVTYESLEALETIIKMGMEEGMVSTLEKLDKLLEKLNK